MRSTSRTPRTAGAGPDDARLVPFYRRVLTLLGIGTVLGALTELAMLRHWQGPAQLVPWAVLTVLLLAAAAWLVRRSAGTARAVQVAAAVSVLGAAYGVYEHVLANLRAGPLDPRYAELWESMSGAARLWLASSGAVGPSPVLVPGTMGLAGVLLWLAVLRWRPAVDGPELSA
ncbi:hypothetical protein [Kocuria sp. CNJ-770]|uniref:hypothetical protein n=1 Tax=Kocuria sp. CNJ-770 TaxID=1904964 RepID=UPI0009F99A46|nr:hypothetical protein [Kocuria sp. CNJ-770]